jgi:hypothetical protein
MGGREEDCKNVNKFGQDIRHLQTALKAVSVQLLAAELTLSSLYVGI